MATMSDGLYIAAALLIGGAVGLLVAIVRYGRAAARYRKYEQELARDVQLSAAAQAAALHCKLTRPRDNEVATP